MNEEIENNILNNEQVANTILLLIRDTCRNHLFCKDCPYRNPHDIDGCLLKTDIPDLWKL